MADTETPNAPAQPGITHNIYKEGRVQSLGFTDASGVDHTVGAVLPGEYDFGMAERMEVITVILGTLDINGFRFTEGEMVTLTEGDQIKITAAAPAAYRCDYY